MTRIIAGTHRGRALVVPPTGTRPTSDRAKEGFFSSLITMIELEGAVVLDLYAGSGAIGLEAVSRGARGATLVESNPTAAQTIRANADKLKLQGVTVEQMSVASYLASTGTVFDAIYLDPPYEKGVATDLCAIDSGGWADEVTVVCVERPTRRSEVIWPHGWVSLKQRKYGEATLWYGRRS